MSVSTMMYLEVAGGLIFLFLGGEMLVRGAVSLARRLGVSPLVIGLTVVGFGTSAPELVVSVEAVLKGADDIAIGNVVGSNIANILLILGTAALIYPIATKPRSVYRDGMILLATTFMFMVAARAGSFYPWEGALMLLLLTFFLVSCYRVESHAETGDPEAELLARESDEIGDLPVSGWTAALIAGAGILILVVGSNLLVDGAVTLARSAGISEAVIGVTLVAVGTSLPELATSIVAAVRRHSDVALGNVIGSNMFNLLGIMGVAALIGPVKVSAKIAGFDMWIMLAATALLLPFMMRGWRLSRTDGILFLIAYGAFVAVQFSGFAGSSLAAG